MVSDFSSLRTDIRCSLLFGLYIVRFRVQLTGYRKETDLIVQIYLVVFYRILTDAYGFKNKTMTWQQMRANKVRNITLGVFDLLILPFDSDFPF